jgi:hypothetical protein
MPIQKEQGRQWSLSAQITVTFDQDLGVDSVADTTVLQEAFRLPVGARVTGGEIIVEEVWDNDTTATIDLGNTGDADRYTDTAPVNLVNLGRTALDLDGLAVGSAERDVEIDPIFTGTNATQGRAVIRIEYTIDGKANEVQPLDVDEYGSARTAV